MSPNAPRTTARQPGTATTTAPATNGSQTITQSTNPTLRLRAQNATPPPSSSQSQRRHIQWDESVVDNEGMGKKSSKVCCIYHAPHEPGDSESEDSSSSSDSDGEPDLSRAQRAGGGGRKGKGEGDAAGKGKGKERKASPNAYERQPRQKGKAKKEG